MKQDIKYTNYICDCCKKESQDANFLTEVKLPVKRCSPSDWQGFWNFSRSVARFEICDDCLEKIYSCLEKTFELLDVDYGGTSIKIREEVKHE